MRGVPLRQAFTPQRKHSGYRPTPSVSWHAASAVQRLRWRSAAGTWSIKRSLRRFWTASRWVYLRTWQISQNKKITECVSDKNIAETLRNLLLENRFDDLLDCIKAYINSTEDAREKANLQELYHYYSENKEALAGYSDRGITVDLLYKLNPVKVVRQYLAEHIRQIIYPDLFLLV